MKLKLFSSWIFFLVLANFADAQFTEKHNLNYNNAFYDILIVPADSTSLLKITTITNSLSLSEVQFFDHLSKSFNQTYFAITASIVDSLCNPLGLLISDANKIKDINLGQGVGNFYLKPNGLLYVDSLGEIVIQESSAFNPSLNYKLALQSGPMLVSKGVVNTSFDKNSKNRNVRCGVGIFEDQSKKYLIFAKSITPVTFFQFTQLFVEKYKCGQALNLESGNNCSIHFPTINLIYRTQIGICRYLVIPF